MAEFALTPESATSLICMIRKGTLAGDMVGMLDAMIAGADAVILNNVQVANRMARDIIHEHARVMEMLRPTRIVCDALDVYAITLRLAGECGQLVAYLNSLGDVRATSEYGAPANIANWFEDFQEHFAAIARSLNQEYHIELDEE